MRSVLRKDKKGALEFESIAIAIMVAMTVVIVLLVIFRADILKFIRVLPGYQYNETDSEVSIDSLDGAAASRICPMKVAKIITTTKMWFFDNTRLKTCKDEACTSYIDTGLVLKGTLSSGTIRATSTGVDVGTLVDGKVSIDGAYLNLNKLSPTQISEISAGDYQGISFELLQNLHNSQYVAGNYLCKSAAALAQEELINKQIELIFTSGESNKIPLVLNAGTKDTIWVSWLFDKKHARVIINMNNGGDVSAITAGDGKLVTVEANQDSALNSQEVMDKVYGEHIELIRKIIGSRYPSEFATNVKEATYFSNVQPYGREDMRSASLEFISEVLYGIDNPKTVDELADKKKTSGEFAPMDSA